MKMTRLLFALLAIVVGLMGVGSSLTARYFSLRPPLRWGKESGYKPERRDRLIACGISLAFFIFGTWLLLGVRWVR